ncbi:uncharacterized, partial [Tachysurus ichikawai]
MAAAARLCVLRVSLG